MPHLRIIETRFTIEDDGNGGFDEKGWSVPYSDETIDCAPGKYDREDGLTVADIAAQLLYEAGTTEWQGSWWAEPDGSQIVDYTAERMETSAHPEGFTDTELDAIRGEASRDSQRSHHGPVAGAIDLFG